VEALVTTEADAESDAFVAHVAAAEEALSEAFGLPVRLTVTVEEPDALATPTAPGVASTTAPEEVPTGDPATETPDATPPDATVVAGDDEDEAAPDPTSSDAEAPQ
jgi:hypothetical protein